MSAMADQSEWSLQDDRGARIQVGIRVRFSGDDPQSLTSAISRGLGIGMLPAGICQKQIESGSLVRVLPSWCAGGADISLLMTHRRGVLPAVRVLANFIAQHLPRSMGLAQAP
jgi:DNA-binding transcriptional LysR family regulator